MTFKDYLKSRLKATARKPEFDPYIQSALEAISASIMLGCGLGFGIAWGAFANPWYLFFLLLVPLSVLLFVHGDYLEDVKGKEKIKEEIEGKWRKND